MSLGGQLRSMYRMPVDMIEAATTGEADKILVNSEFTAQVFAKTFLEMGRLPRVVYPAVDVTAYGGKVDVKKEDAWLVRYVALRGVPRKDPLTRSISQQTTDSPLDQPL